MPRYDYFCKSNGRTLEVIHSIKECLTRWDEVCKRVGIEPGDTSIDAPVRRVILTAPMANTPTSDSDIKQMGFTKLVKRDDGVYENVTRSGTESRYMRSDDPSSMPHLHKKISD